MYEGGREGNTPMVGFAPRKNALVLYSVLTDAGNEQLAARLEPHSVGKGCLYIPDLSAVDAQVLARMIDGAFRERNEPGSDGA